MKVAYINCLLSGKGQLGVEKKLAAQARAIALLGLDMDIFYCNFAHELRGSRVHFYRRREGFLNQVLSVLHRYSCISRHIDTGKYDLLVLRYSGGDFSLFSSFFRKNAGKIVTEHHTKELQEAYAYKTTLPQRAVTLFMERFLGPNMIRRCAGLIGLTDEIKEYELERAGVSIPACTVANGVLVQDIPFSRHAPYNGSALNLLCMANSFDEWYGLDRVLGGLENYSSQKPFLHLSLVGNVFDRHLNLSKRLSRNERIKIDVLGRLHGPKLEQIFENTHIAFSSLASFRAKVRDACTLKTREYTARGLPFVIGYHDPDLEGEDEFFMTVPPNNSPINMDHVVAFAERILNRKGVSRSMRKFAEKRLDWKIKMQVMWDFLESVYRGRRSASS
jgi:hypothetical protein